MIVIGLCGGSGSGKGTVCSIFEEFGIKSIDTDKLYHSLISTDSECTNELVSTFGEVIYANPGINRRALRDIVFTHPEKLRLLNKITHKHILTKVRDFIKESGTARGIIVDAPLLFESGFDKECDVTVCVIADDDVRIKRIIDRDDITFDVAKARIDSQIKNTELIKMCDYSIDNNSTEVVLRTKIAELEKQLFNN